MKMPFNLRDFNGLAPTTTDTSRRGVLKLFPAAIVAGISPAITRQSNGNDLVDAVLGAISAPRGATNLKVTVSQHEGCNAITATCVSASGSVLYRNPHSGAWS